MTENNTATTTPQNQPTMVTPRPAPKDEMSRTISVLPVHENYGADKGHDVGEQLDQIRNFSDR
jgi:hypothetical protein